MIQRYVAKISGPLLDRIDIHIDVPAVKTGREACRLTKYRELRAEESAESSTEIRAPAERARAAQLERFAKDGGIFYARQRPDEHGRCGELRRHCAINEARRGGLLETAITRMGLSARAHDRILKVARTIADLEGAPSIASRQIAEAVQYRSLDRTYWA